MRSARLGVRLLLCVVLAGCGDDDGPDDASADGSHDALDGGRDAASPETGPSGDAGDDGAVLADGGPMRDISFRSAITRVQPMTGVVLWESSWNGAPIKRSDAISLEYAYVAPDTIVTARDTYDWTDFDAFLDRVASREHQAIVRFYYTYPGRETTVPAYIKALPDYEETVGTSEERRTVFPDWRHPELQRFHLELFERFAARYDHDPRIAFLQVGFGLWAEYHIYDGPRTLGEQFPSKAFQATFLRHLSSELTELHWSVSIDAASSTYSPFSEDDELRALRFGLFDDSFMHEGHGGYNETSWRFFDHERRVERAPHGGELSYYTAYDQEHVLDVEGLHGRTYEELSARFGITYMIGNDQPHHQSIERIRDAGLANGYKLEVLAFRASATRAEVEVRNFGIAPLYYDAWVAVDGVRAGESLRGLQPGEQRVFTIDAGGSAPTLTVECDRLVPGQRIELRADL